MTTAFFYVRSLEIIRTGSYNNHPMPTIEVENLTKIYRVTKKKPGISGAIQAMFKREYSLVNAVQDVSFKIEEGELVGFLGPNGAGKTTTLKMLSGILFPTTGTATVLGFTPWERKNDYRKQFALVMGQKNQLWWDLPAHAAAFAEQPLGRDGDVEVWGGAMRMQRREQPGAARAEDQDVGRDALIGALMAAALCSLPLKGGGSGRGSRAANQSRRKVWDGRRMSGPPPQPSP